CVCDVDRAEFERGGWTIARLTSYWNDVREVPGLNFAVEPLGFGVIPRNITWVMKRFFWVARWGGTSPGSRHTHDLIVVAWNQFSSTWT
ncbi:hypothetical protein DYB36_014192, partial [Aphanomyces astaci]